MAPKRNARSATSTTSLEGRGTEMGSLLDAVALGNVLSTGRAPSAAGLDLVEATFIVRLPARSLHRAPRPTGVRIASGPSGDRHPWTPGSALPRCVRGAPR